MSLLTDFDLHLLGEGTHARAYEKLGAHVGVHEGQAGTHFAVWAPNAKGVSVVGDFNGWNPSAAPMTPSSSGGLWETFLPGVGVGAIYKYAIASKLNGYKVDKADPYGFAAEIRPQTASKVCDLSGYTWADNDWMARRKQKNAADAPISIYEVHLGSWMRVPDEGNRWLTYAEIAEKLADYVSEITWLLKRS